MIKYSSSQVLNWYCAITLWREPMCLKKIRLCYAPMHSCAEKILTMQWSVCWWRCMINLVPRITSATTASILLAPRSARHSSTLNATRKSARGCRLWRIHRKPRKSFSQMNSAWEIWLLSTWKRKPSAHWRQIDMSITCLRSAKMTQPRWIQANLVN